MLVVALIAASLVKLGSGSYSKICADVCQCSKGVTDQSFTETMRVDCHGQDLTTVPSSKLIYDAWHASSIDLSNNLITRLDRNAFRSQKLVELRLDQNDIEEVDDAAFNVTTPGWPFVRTSPLRFLNLKGNNLHSIPKAFGTTDKTTADLNNLWSLQLGGNPFGKNIHSDSFSGVEQVVKLDLSRCMLTSLPGIIFKNMHNLRELNLSFNSLSVIPQTSFGKNLALTILRLDGNNLAGIPHRLPKNIKVLCLASNMIRNLTEEDRFSLARLRKLEILDLSGNLLRLHPFGSFSTLSNLKLLDLSHNHIDRVTFNTFAGLGNLHYLFLNNNPILTSFEHGALEPLASVRYLFLNGCTLAKIFMSPSSPGVASLRYLWLYGNPINCNCEVAPFIQTMRKNEIQLDADVREIPSQESDEELKGILKSKLETFDKEASPTVCAGPSNRLRKVVGRTIANVPVEYLTCPDEPIYVVVSVFLGIFLFAAAIPVVFCMIGFYLLLVRLAKTQLGWKFDDAED